VGVLGFAAAAQSGPRLRSTAASRLSPQVVRAALDLSDTRLQAFKASFDPAAAALASRHDPRAHPELWGRPAAWASYDVSRAPSLGLAVVTPEDAQRLNSYLPGSGAPPAKPFVLKTRDDAERARALRCLSQAVYHEAALEPMDGQRAVAQVVLNRVKHPEYPDSVCGVVFQGWERWTGCQFSFTCDGSLLRGVVPVYWRQAEQVAREALEGHVEQRVGTATHYHADYVVPYWRSSLTKVGQVGRHIFYRWPGRPGLPGAFTDRYDGRGELRLSDLVLAGRASRPTPPPSKLPIDPTMPVIPGVTTETIVVADASAPGGETTRVRSIIAGRRQPNAEDIARINEVLARGNTATEAPAPAAAKPAAAMPKPCRSPRRSLRTRAGDRGEQAGRADAKRGLKPGPRGSPVRLSGAACR
jgi:spore germination cell wall hydrolase CwlJ-like protein